MTEKAGLTGMPQNRYGMGVAVGDYDNDGFDDLYVTNYGGNTLYHNNGDGTFTDVTARAGVAAGGWSASAGFFDYDNDGRLDLFVTRYVEWSFQDNRYCGEKKPGYRAYCHPDNYDGHDQRPVPQQRRRHVHRRVGEGRHRRRRRQGARRLVRRLRRRRLHRHLRRQRLRAVASCSTTTATARSPRSACWPGVGFNEDGKTFAGMGVDFADYDNDGRPDIVVTDLSNERYMLFRQNGDGSFRDVTNASGLGGATLPFSGWSTRFFDYDNDGWKDLFVAQGHVMDTIEKTAPNLKYLQPPLLLRNESAASSRVDAGDVVRAGRGPAAAPRSAISTTTATSTSSSSNVGQNARRAAERRRQPAELAGDPDRRHDVESRRHRVPREGRVRVRPDAVLHRQHGGRLPLGQRQAAARRPRRRRRRPRSSRSAGRPASSRHSRTSRPGRRSTATEPAQ